MEQAKHILPRVLVFQGTPDMVDWQLDLIRAYWPEAVGPRLANHSEPVRVQESTLFVQVSDSGWLEEFGHMQRQIVALLQQEMGTTAVTRIRFQLRAPERPERPRGPVAARSSRRSARARRKP